MRPLLPNGEEIPDCDFRIEYKWPKSKVYVVKRLEPNDPDLVRWRTLDEELSADHRMVLDTPRQEVSLDNTGASVSVAKCVYVKGFKIRITSINN